MTSRCESVARGGGWQNRAMTSTRPEAPAEHPRRPPPASAPRSLTPVEMALRLGDGGTQLPRWPSLSVVIPFAGGLSLLVPVPMGLLGYRYRLRVLLAAAFAASTVAFLIAGISGFMVVLNCAYVGGATGIIKRRGWVCPWSSWRAPSSASSTGCGSSPS